MFSASSLARVSPAGWYQSNGPAGIAALYVALQFGYSLWAKQYVVLDVIAVAIGFVLRAFGGAVAIGAEVLPWPVFITFVLAMLLALTRRRNELVAMNAGAPAHRKRAGTIQRPPARSDARDRR
jgi:4-hydroxybenzoate polyprenyltransferase